jgi:hypothetical protein
MLRHTHNGYSKHTYQVQSWTLNLVYTYCNGTTTSAIQFTGTFDVVNWTNDNPSIGLAASGTGDIASFVATNNGNIPVK